MRTVVAIAEEGVFEKRWEKVVRNAELGLTDETEQAVQGAIDELFNTGLLELFKLEEKAQVMQWRFEKHLIKNDILKELRSLKVLLPPEASDERAQLERTAETIEKVLTEFYEGIRKDYSVYFEQSREQQEHRFINRARGVATLARQMRDVYKLRGEYKSEKKDIESIEETLSKFTAMMIGTQRRVSNGLGSLPENTLVLRYTRDLKEECKVLANHVQSVVSEFTHISRVFANYFFMLQQYHKLITEFLNHLETEGYPERELHELKRRLSRFEEKEQYNEKRISDAEARMGRLLQRFLPEIHEIRKQLR